MDLLIDIGNSHIKWAMLDTKGVLSNFATAQVNDGLADILNKVWGNLPQPVSCWICSVANRHIRHLVVSFIEQRWQLAAHIVASETHAQGVTNAYTDPRRLGCDRWVAMIAAYQQTQSAVMVVSSGTAMTIDAVDEQGQHLGGLILPGKYMAEQALIANTNIELQEPVEGIESGWLANNTEQAIQKGIILSQAALIEKLYASLNQTHANLHCFLAGGGAKQLSPHVGFAHTLEQHLVLKGLAKLAAST